VLDPTIFTVAYKRNRFYLYTSREPVDIESDKHQLIKRDIINEKPTKEESQSMIQPNSSELAKQVNIIILTLGFNRDFSWRNTY
jgi:peptidylprolyl isomerase domain and WD repeat-containing protein 1